jgi:hypothetical protein
MKFNMVGGKNGILLGTKSPYKKYFEIYCKIAIFVFKIYCKIAILYLILSENLLYSRFTHVINPLVYILYVI